MEKELLSDAEKIRTERTYNILNDYERISEDNPKALKSVIISFIAKKRKVSGSTVRNILKTNGK